LHCKKDSLDLVTLYNQTPKKGKLVEHGTSPVFLNKIKHLPCSNHAKTLEQDWNKTGTKPKQSET
jgi:hypothetical protein